MPAQSFELLVEFTKDDDPRTRAMAIAGLAKLRDPRGFAPVVVTLFDPVDEVRVTAATALGLLGDDRAFEPLASCLADPCEMAAVNSAWAFGQIQSERCFDKLLEIVADEDLRPAVRTAGAMALGERAEHEGSDLSTRDDCIERARVTLLNVFDDEANELRAASIWALGHLPADKQTTYAIIDMLKDEYEWVVRYAIEALAHFGDVAAVEPLEELSESENEDIRTLVYQALDALH